MMLLLKGRADGWKKPTPAQAAAGNYKKPRMKWNGLDINIENPAGTVREGTDETGAKWRTVFAHAYGEIAGTEGVDGDPVDVYMGPDESAPEVYIVRQMKRKKWDAYDEDKCFLGFKSMAAAKKAYLDHYDDPRFFGGIIAMPVAEFIKKVRATKEKPAMIKSMVLFYKAATS
jgi:Inorganic Pyrophosphatase